MVGRPQAGVVFRWLIEAQTAHTNSQRFRDPDEVDAAIESFPIRMSRLAIDFAEQNLPRVGDKPKRLDDSELCNLDLLSAARCPAATARRAPGSRVP